MLPPLLPLSTVPTTEQHGRSKSTPSIPAVGAVQSGLNAGTSHLRQRDPEQAPLALHDGQERQRQRRKSRRAAGEESEEDSPLEPSVGDSQLETSLLEDESRLGVWIDIEV